MKRALLLAVLTLAACDDTIPGMCKSDSDCVAPAYCYMEFCVFEEEGDGGADDAAVDAGPADASDNDAGGDAGSLDGSQSSTDGDAVGITSFTATPAIITQGQSTTLAWTLSEAWSASIDQGIGPVWGSSVTVTPSSDETYTLTASNRAGSTSSAKLTVHVVPPPKIASFSAAPSIIAGGKTSTLSWSTTGAASLSIDNGIGAVTGTSIAVNPTVTTKYTLKAANAAGATDTATTTVTLDSAPPTLTIDSPAIDATCGATCTGAVFNLASSANVIFQGKAQDENGLASTDGLVATLDGQPATVFTSGSSWQFTWQNLPAENGKFHTFTVVAADAAGNKTSASRTIYVDRVAPTCSGTQDGKRLISRTATLLQCSEAMEVSSVQTAVGFVPTASGLASNDGLAFAFANAAGLLPYQSYTLSFANTARDRAGNLVAAPASARFLTEAVLPPKEGNLSSSVLLSSVGESAPLALDIDGKPSLALVIGTHETGISTAAIRWDGKGGWQTTVISTLAIMACDPDSVPCDSFSVASFHVSSEIAPDLTLSNNYHLLIAKNHGGSACGNELYYLRSSDFLSWRGLGATSPDIASSIFCRDEGASIVSEHSGSSASTSIIAPYWVSGDPWASEGIALTTQPRIFRMNQTADTWLAPAPVTQPSAENRISGSALAKDGNAFRAIPSDTVLPFQYGTSISDLVFYGAQQIMLRTSNGYTPTGSAFLAWSEFRSSANESYPAVYLACAQNPSNPSSWNRSIDLSPIPQADRNNGERPRRIHVGLGPTKAAIALQTDRNRVFFGTFENGTCQGAPTSPNWSVPIAQSTYPSVAVGVDGTVWRAWIDTTSKRMILAH